MARYRRRSTVVEANQYTNIGCLPLGLRTREDGSCYVVTIHGQETEVALLDWIVQEPDGEHYYPIKPDIFAATYEPADTPATLTDRERRLVEAVEGHFRGHYPVCGAKYDPSDYGPPRACTCGYDALVNALAAYEEPE